MDFLYKISSTDGCHTLTLKGRLDTLSAAELEKGIAPLLSNPGKHLTVSIPELTYISSSGLRCFVRMLNACRGAGAEMTVEGMQPSIKEIFDLTGFSKIFLNE